MLFQREGLKMKTTCTHCQKSFKVDDKFEGRKARCPGCNKEFTIADSSKTVSVPHPKSNPPGMHLDNEVKEFYSVKELAALLNVNPMTIYRKVQRGQITCYQVGRIKRFHRHDVELFLDSCAI